MADLNNKIQFIPNLNLQRNNTISDAFKAIEGRFGMVVTIIEGHKHLCGVISEGDLRRAVLNGYSLDTPLEKIMSTKPVVLELNDLTDELKCLAVTEQIYRRYGSEQGKQATIPVIDKNGDILGLVVPEMLPIKGKLKIASNGRRFGSPHVLVVGGAGFIGSVFVRMLLKEGWRVRVLDNLLYLQTSLDGINSENFSLMRGDATNINDLVEAVEEIDAVVYLAEIVGDAACAHSPEKALKTNYLSVMNMAHLCAHLNINRFIYTSSCSVYGAAKGIDEYLSEESSLNPLSHYGRMKIITEQVLLGITNPLFAPTILRLATVFGYSHRPRFDLVVNTFAKNAFFRKSIEVFGGNQWRPNIHVSDVARAIIKILEVPIDLVSKQIFNVGNSSQNYTINQIAELTAKVFPEVRIEQHSNSLDLRNYRVGFSKFENTLGFKAKLSVLDGLRELKAVFEKGEIVNPNESRYSNIEAIRELVSE